MKLLARIVRFLFWAVFLWWAVWLIGRVMAWALGGKPGKARASQGRTMPSGPPSRPLYRDPVCGTHVSGEISLVVEQAGHALHFCSAECRERYLVTRRLAVNG